MTKEQYKQFYLFLSKHGRCLRSESIAMLKLGNQTMIYIDEVHKLFQDYFIIIRCRYSLDSVWDYPKEYFNLEFINLEEV